ncbi:MAG: hypothetical protein LBP20_04810 [Treponema sp.]|nr:hypothetical protein [Treponema sp.]
MARVSEGAGQAEVRAAAPAYIRTAGQSADRLNGQAMTSGLVYAGLTGARAPDTGIVPARNPPQGAGAAPRNIASQSTTPRSTTPRIIAAETGNEDAGNRKPALVPAANGRGSAVKNQASLPAAADTAPGSRGQPGNGQPIAGQPSNGLPNTGFPDWDLLWTGSWKEGANLTNRADLKLRLAGPGLTLRAELLDRRGGDPETLFHRLPWNVDKATTNLLGGLYHASTGSRLLYGPLEEWGLAARLRGPWARALPFAESRKASGADLRTSPSTKKPALYLYLGTPFFEPPGTGSGLTLRGFASARVDPARLGAAEAGEIPRPPLGEGTALTAALEGRLGTAAAFSLEGFYTASTLPARKSSSWFSKTRPLPPQKFSLYALGMLFKTARLSLSGDLAWSRTSILGDDIYANLGFRTGGPRNGWQLSLAADGAGRNYTGSDGVNPGAGFRAGGKFEWRHSRAGQFGINTTVSGPGLTINSDGDLDLRFDRSSSGFYYRPPATKLPLRLSRISLGADRDARDTVKDSADLNISLTANPQNLVAGLSGGTANGAANSAAGILTLNVSGSLTGSPAGDWGQGKTGREPWPVPGGSYYFESAKAGGELSWAKPVNPGFGWAGPGKLRLAAGLNYTVSVPDAEEEFETSRNFTLRAALNGSRDRLSASLSCPAFPWEDMSIPWELSLSWSVKR